MADARGVFLGKNSTRGETETAQLAGALLYYFIMYMVYLTIVPRIKEAQHIPLCVVAVHNS